MPSAFNVTAANNDLQLPATREGSVALTISNISGAPQRGQISIAALDTTKPTWLSVDGGQFRDFPVGGVQQVTIQIAVPNDVLPGHYTFRPDVIPRDNPDENSTQGPILAFEVPPIPKGPPPPWYTRIPWWAYAAAAAAVVLIVGVVLYLFVLSTVVPPVVNSNEQSANTAIQGVGLVPQDVGPQFCPRFQALFVSVEQPAAGSRVLRNSQVQLTVVCRSIIVPL